MSTQTISRAAEIVDIIDRMPPDSVIIQHGVDWNDYEELLEAVGEARGLRISYSEGRLQIMTLSPKHEKYTRLLDLLVGLLAVRLRIRVLFYGSSTIKKQPEQKGADGDSLAIYRLQKREYVESETSHCLPLLTGRVLTQFLARSPKEDQYDIMLAFEEWLKTQK